MGGGYLCTFEFGSVVSGSRSTLRCMYICVFVLFSHTIRHYPVYKRLSSEIERERVESWHLAVCLVFVRLTFYFVGDKLHVHIFIQLCRHSVMAHQSDPQILFGDDRSRWNFLPSFFFSHQFAHVIADDLVFMHDLHDFFRGKINFFFLLFTCLSIAYNSDSSSLLLRWLNHIHKSPLNLNYILSLFSTNSPVSYIYQSHCTRVYWREPS